MASRTPCWFSKSINGLSILNTLWDPNLKFTRLPPPSLSETTWLPVPVIWGFFPPDQQVSKPKWAAQETKESASSVMLYNWRFKSMMHNSYHIFLLLECCSGTYQSLLGSTSSSEKLIRKRQRWWNGCYGNSKGGGCRYVEWNKKHSFNK